MCHTILHPSLLQGIPIIPIHTFIHRMINNIIIMAGIFTTTHQHRPTLYRPKATKCMCIYMYILINAGNFYHLHTGPAAAISLEKCVYTEPPPLFGSNKCNDSKHICYCCFMFSRSFTSHRSDIP